MSDLLMLDSVKDLLEHLALTLKVDAQPWLLAMLIPLMGAIILRRRQDD